MCIDYFSLFIFQAVGFCGENTLSLEIFRSNLVVKDNLIWLIVLILSYIHVLSEAKEMRIKFKYACEIALSCSNWAQWMYLHTFTPPWGFSLHHQTPGSD